VANALQGHHLQRGIVRAWGNGTNVVIVNLLQFEPGGNSNRWVSEATVALVSSYGSGRFPELNNAKWAQLAHDAHNWEIRTLIYKGDFVAVVHILAAESQTPDTLKAIATEQMDRLP
jgi:hypothetical protein